MSPFTIPFFGTINSLRGGIHQKMAVSQYPPADFRSMIYFRGGGRGGRRRGGAYVQVQFLRLMISPYLDNLNGKQEQTLFKDLRH